MHNLFGVTLFHRCVVNWSLGGEMFPQYLCIMLYVKVIWCNGIPYIYFQLEWGYMYHQYMCILLYVTLMWCNGVP